jgi:regulator of sigma E protease
MKGMSIFLFIVGLVLFIGLIIVHEFGHFIAARRNGVETEEFGIFFPPTLYTRKMKGGWLFKINALPLGGYVKLKGEHDTDTEKGSFGAATLWGKTKIMAAGVVMNLIVAYVLLVIIALLGMPQLVDHQFTVKSDTKVTKSAILVTYIEPNSPAQKAGIQFRDQITAIGRPGHQEKLSSATHLPDVTKRYAGQTVAVSYVHNGTAITRQVKLRSTAEIAASLKTSNPKGALGISPTEFTLKRSTWSAPIVAGGLVGQYTGLTFQGLGKAVAGLGGIIAGAATGNTTARQHGQTDAGQVSGPVGIYELLKGGSALGYQFMLLIIAIISLTLAIMNILPIPALDGGRLWITLIARAFKRPLSSKVEETVNAIGFIVLLTLIAVVTVVDVKRYF